MTSVLDQYVGCNECAAEITVQQAFDDANVSWPQKSWIAFQCRNCGATNHLQLANDTVTEGYLDGAPGPCFIARRTVGVAQMRVKTHHSGVSIQNLDLSWNVPAR